MKFNCTNCQYVEKTPRLDAKGTPVIGESQYACKRFPPSAFVIMNPRGGFATGSAFPNVTELMVCGEYHQKEPVKNAVKMMSCEHGQIKNLCPVCSPIG
jgi:hypothetical protein